LRRRRQEMGWPMSDQEFSQISDHALDTVVRNVLSLPPNSGERMVPGSSQRTRSPRSKKQSKGVYFPSRSGKPCFASFQNSSETSLQCNKAATVLQLFRGAVRTFGLHTRMRCDHGTENIEVARLMLWC